MLIAYFTSVFFIIPLIGKIIKQLVGKLKNKNSYTLSEVVALLMYVYLCFFVVLYIRDLVSFIQ